MFEWVVSPEAWIALGTLTALEIVLGIDNIIFISILVGRLPENQRNLGRRVGLGLAMIARLALLFAITWVMGLTTPWFTVLTQEFSGRDMILLLGGLFLLGKSTHEIHHSLGGRDRKQGYNDGCNPRVRPFAGCSSGYRFFAGFSDNGGGPGKACFYHGGCHCPCRRGYVDSSKSYWGFRRCTSDDQNSGALVSDFGRRHLNR